MKKILILCLTIVMLAGCFAFTGCSKNDSSIAQADIHYCYWFSNDDKPSNLNDLLANEYKTIEKGERVVVPSEYDLATNDYIWGYQIDTYGIYKSTWSTTEDIYMVTYIKLKSYSIKYNLDGGKSVKALKDIVNRNNLGSSAVYFYKDDAAFKADYIPTKAGYEFAGWAMADYYTGELQYLKLSAEADDFALDEDGNQQLRIVESTEDIFSEEARAIYGLNDFMLIAQWTAVEA